MKVSQPLSICIFICLTIPFVFSSSNCGALWQLDGLSQCEMNESYTNYMNYGCACSNINMYKPVDSIDKCCETHTLCYESLNVVCSNPDSPSYCTYNWYCLDGQIICSKNADCLQRTCVCDKALIDCLSAYKYPYVVKKCNYPNFQHEKEHGHPAHDKSSESP